MGYMTNGLTFNTLRGGNIARLPHFKNKHGELAHSKPDGSDWSPAQWLQAVMGELGEYANLRKKYERGDLTAAEFEVEAAKELADVQCYLDILALRALDTPEQAHPTGIDLGRATMNKFNEVSARVGSRVYLDAEDWHLKAEVVALADPTLTLEAGLPIMVKGPQRAAPELVQLVHQIPGTRCWLAYYVPNDMRGMEFLCHGPRPEVFYGTTYVLPSEVVTGGIFYVTQAHPHELIRGSDAQSFSERPAYPMRWFTSVAEAIAFMKLPTHEKQYDAA